MSTVITVGDKLQAKSVGDQILCTNLGLDWVAAGLALKLRVKLGSGATRDLALSAVIGQPQQAFLSTLATTFPDAGTYQAQIIGLLGSVEQRFSSVFLIEIKSNLS